MFPTPMIPIRTRSIWLSLPRASLHGRCCAKTGGYGVFALMSSDTRIDSNRAEGNAEAGFYVGDSPRANATVVNNESSNNQFAVRSEEHTSELQSQFHLV